MVFLDLDAPSNLFLVKLVSKEADPIVPEIDQTDEGHSSKRIYKTDILSGCMQEYHSVFMFLHIPCKKKIKTSKKIIEEIS
jgi:hypothetical protein